MRSYSRNFYNLGAKYFDEILDHSIFSLTQDTEINPPIPLCSALISSKEKENNSPQN